MSRPRIDALTPAQASGFWPLSPDVAIEVKSEADEFADVVAKIETSIERGSSYAATPRRQNEPNRLLIERTFD